MVRFATCVVVGMVLFSGSLALAAEPLPGTLNFSNETATRINQTVAENPGANVKEVGFGDFDKDNDLDMAVIAAGGVFGTRQNKLYRNDNGVFNEVSGAPIISGFTTNDLTRHVFFYDYDGDTWLDLCVVNDDLAGGGPIKIYYNNHPGDVFDSFTETQLSFEASCGAVSLDIDQNNTIDIYSGNYPGPSQDSLFLNDGTGTFTVVTPTHVPTDGDYTIDVAAGDLNGDGLMDLLVSNEFDPWYVYYNNKNDEGDHGDGDFKYGASGYGGRQHIGTSDDGAMEAADFNNDDRVDFYWSNKVGSNGDRIMMNTGNDAAGMATFSEIIPPPYTTATSCNKISVADLNADGRVDVVVGVPSNRPAVLRNTSVGGAISFVDWTPASAFPTGSTLGGHHAGLFDTNGDGDMDIVLGAQTGDHLFENVSSAEYDEANLTGGIIPNVFNQGAVAVVGAAAEGESDTYTINGLGSNAFLSVVLHGDGDYLLEILDSGNTVQQTIDRGGLGVEEATQFDPAGSPSTMKIRVTVTQSAPPKGDVNDDGNVDGLDIREFVRAVLDPAGCALPFVDCELEAADTNGDGQATIADLSQFVDLVLTGGTAEVETSYILEVLSRN